MMPLIISVLNLGQEPADLDICASVNIKEPHPKECDFRFQKKQLNPRTNFRIYLGDKLNAFPRVQKYNNRVFLMIKSFKGMHA
jgi:hypothetical protein